MKIVILRGARRLEGSQPQPLCWAQFEGTSAKNHPQIFLEEAYMRTWLQNAWSHGSSQLSSGLSKLGALSLTALVAATGALAAQSSEAGGEANLKLPDLSSVKFLGGI